MSDDPKNPDDKKPNFAMGDIFDQNANTKDPNELPDDVAFGAADSSVEESTEQSTPEGEAETEQAAVNDSNVIPINGRGPAKANAEHVINPELDESTRATAAAFRKVQSNSPVLTGKDADLVQWNNKLLRIEPKDADSAAILSRMGDDADISANYPGTLVSKPLKFDSASMSMKPNSAKGDKPIQRPNEIGQIDNIIIQTPDDRLKRMSGLDADSEKEKQKKESADRRIQQAMEEKEEKKEAADRIANQPQGAGAAITNAIGGGLSKLFQAIGRFLRAAVAAISSAKDQIGSMITNIGSSKSNAQSASDSASSEMPMVSPKSEAEMGGTLGPNGAKGAAAGLMGRVTAAKQNVSQASNTVVQEYRVNTKKNIEALNKGLGTHEVGSELVKSPEMFRDKLGARRPQDKARVTKALNGNRETSEQLTQGVERVVKHPDMEMLPAGEKAHILNTLNSEVSKGVKVDALSELAITNAVDDKGLSFTQQSSQGVNAAKQSISSELEKATQQAQVEQVSRQIQEQAQRASHTEEHRPSPN